MKKLKVHFVGIKGVGMTPLAIIAKEAGFIVTGSDIDKEFITDEALKKAGINILNGFSKEHITNPDLVIITGAHNGFDNVEAQEAKDKNIKVKTQGEAVGEFMDGGIFKKDFIGISVLGTHGKTTTTAMIATILNFANFDPSYLVGTGNVGLQKLPGHFGKGKYFIAEADEYATEPKYNKTPKFMWQSPKIGVITNIEFDHPDVFSSLDDMRNAYVNFVNKLPKNSTIVICGDDPEIRKAQPELKTSTITYGFSNSNDYVVDNVHISGEHMFFRVMSKGMIISDFMIKVAGDHNALNATSAVVVCLELGLSIEKIKKGLLEFTGSKRRLEYIGELLTGGKVYDDYAHHPTEIKKTLNTLRQQYPNKKIVCIFQPHTYSRTKALFEEFRRAFDNIDELFVIVTDIYASLREEKDETISGKKLAEGIALSKKDVHYLPTLLDVVQYINEKRFRSDTVLVTMGAGDVYTIHSKLEFL